MARRKGKKISLSGIIIFIILVALVCVGYFLYTKYIKKDEPKPVNTDNSFIETTNKVYDSSNLAIHFMDLGNKYNGDCVYIKAGDTDILIDAGSRDTSAIAISEYINTYVTDNTLEYVIATHAHQDHISGFVGNNDVPGIFERYVCETIIDYPKSDATSKVSKNYIIKRNAEVEEGANHYTALECYNNKNGAQRIYELSDGIELEILYNYFYDHDATDENDYSVCVMINQSDRHFLFTGDLHAKGESYLIEYNTLPEMELFKAGHHGSYTATSAALLAEIKPKIICVCCCCGSTEYTNNMDNVFPSQAFVSRVCKYTDKIYVTSITSTNQKGYEMMNGNIVITSNKDNLLVNCSNNNIIFKDSEWFKKYREWK